MVDYVLSAAMTQGPGPTPTVTSPTTADAPPRELPPVVREQLDAPTPRPHGWATTIAPAFLGVVVWFPLLDGFGGRWLVAVLGGHLGSPFDVSAAARTW